MRVLEESAPYYCIFKDMFVTMLAVGDSLGLEAAHLHPGESLAVHQLEK